MAPSQISREVTIPGRPHFLADYARSPRSVKRMITYHFSTNALGLRSPEVSSPPRRGVFRIVVDGECVAFGHGVEDDQVWPAMLGRVLQERHPQMQFDVVNGGVPAASPQVLGARLRDLYLPMRPDLLVFAPGANTVYLPQHQGMVQVRVRLTEAEYDQERRVYRQVLEQAAQATRQSGVPMVLVTPTMNTFFMPDGQVWLDEITRFASEQSIPLLDTTTLFRAREARDGLVLESADGVQRLVSNREGQRTVLLETPFEDDNSRYVAQKIYKYLDDHPEVSPLLSIDENHPNPQGHRAIAEAMATLLDDNHLISPPKPHP